MLMMQEHGKLFVAPPIARDVIFNVLPDPVIVVDGDARVLEANPAAWTLPGSMKAPSVPSFHLSIPCASGWIATVTQQNPC